MPNHILIIDDEELVIKSLKKLLEDRHFSVAMAMNGQEALAVAEKDKFDLIIADIRMPGMSGVEIIQAIYENLKKRNLSKIPVIFITGYADEEIKQQAETLNPVAYIYKPFDNTELFSKINLVLKNKNLSKIS